MTGRKSTINAFLIAGVSFALLMTSGCSEVTSDAKENKVVSLVPVQAEKVVLGDIDAAYGTTSILEAAQESKVLARQVGVVTEIRVEEGDYVEAGQILAQLETEQLALELMRAEANLKKVANDLKRQKKIYSKNLVSSEEFERIKFEYEAQRAQTQLARLNLEYATIRAPISGTVANRFIKLGNLLAKNQPAFHITDMETLHAVIHMPESEKAELQQGQTAYINVAGNESEFEGIIERISPVVDSDTGSIRVTVAVQDASRTLRPGMFSRVGIIYDTHKDALLIPKSAVVTQDNEAYVYVVDEGKAIKKGVNLGFSSNHQVEIVSGLGLESMVITMGQRNLKDKADVEIIEAVANL